MCRERNNPNGSGQATVVPVKRSTPRRNGINSASMEHSVSPGRSGTLWSGIWARLLRPINQRQR